jgi:transporter family protein
MNVPSWLVNASLTMFLWGFWGFFGKLASRSLTPQNSTMISLLGWIASFPVILFLFRQHFRVEWNDPHYYFAFISGLFGSIGGVFFFYALNKGDASQVVAVTALYPLITVILAYLFLHEPVTLPRFAGIFFALVGIYFLSR